MLKRRLIQLAHTQQMGIIGLFKMIVQRPAAKGLLIDPPEGGQMQRVGIAEKKDAVPVPQGFQEFDPFGREIEQQGIPGADDLLIRRPKYRSGL